MPKRTARSVFFVGALTFVIVAPSAAQMLPVTSAPSPPAEVAAGAPPGQPFVSYWHPTTLLSWDPLADPDAPFNRSTVPLGTRFANPALGVNAHARANEARIAALVAFGPTSNNPSQGALDMSYYALNYWQYVDVLVFWGGSASEGLILAPNATVIDAAHRNGVPVLGNVFFPPVVFGGQIQWVWDFVQRDGSNNFPVADKLIEAAEYYGFDGWFINQETAGGNATLAAEMRDLISYVQANSNLRVLWYDAMTESGSISWQNALTAQNDWYFQFDGELVSDDMFLNFNWSATGLSNSRALAVALGRSPYELYAGADVEANGYNTNVNWNALFPEASPHVVSLGFYRPEWTYNGSSSPANFYVRDNRFWVGANRDPGNTTTASNWKGMAHYVPATSPIDALPFVTHFDTGQGNRFAVDGDVLANGGWNNLSLQDVLPTWRWIVQSTGTLLYPDLDWSDAYWGGTSLLVSGTLDAVNDLKLYETSLDVGVETHLAIVHKTGSAGSPTRMEVAIAFEDDPATFELFDVGIAASAGWDTTTFDLGAHAGRTIGVVALRFAPGGGPEPYSIRIGRLAVYDGTSEVPAPPSGLTVESKNEITPVAATLRLRWTDSPDPIHSYNVYRLNPDSSLTYLGGTPNDAYFVSRVNRVGDETTTTIELEAVSPERGRSSRVTTSFDWDVPVIFFDGFESGNTSAWSSTVG